MGRLLEILSGMNIGMAIDDILLHSGWHIIPLSHDYFYIAMSVIMLIIIRIREAGAAK